MSNRVIELFNTKSVIIFEAASVAKEAAYSVYITLPHIGTYYRIKHNSMAQLRPRLPNFTKYND